MPFIFVEKDISLTLIQHYYFSGSRADIEADFVNIHNRISAIGKHPNCMADYQDHHYPSEMSVDAMIQTFLLDTRDNAQEKFLKKFDSDWKRYNRDLIRKVQDYQKEQEDAQ